MIKWIQRVLLSPASFLYGLAVGLHQSLYWSGFLKSIKFSVPVISIGNLSVGGTGKSPHVYYLLELLREYIHPAVISRGYKRKTEGFRLVNRDDQVSMVGDEALQTKIKFPDIPVAVAESRALGIPALLAKRPEIQLVLMDDGFQHLQVKPGLNILLTEYASPFSQDALLPGGRLREWRHGAGRADIIIVSKCPKEPTAEETTKWRKELNIHAHQKLFFSTIRYSKPYHFLNPQRSLFFNQSMHVTVLSAIAQSSYLVNEIAQHVASTIEISFEDHHYFSEQEIREIIRKFNAISNPNKIILTTEKDATRLTAYSALLEQEKIDIFVMPISIDFYQKNEFDQTIKQFLLDFKI